MHFYDLFNALKDEVDFYLCHNTNKVWHYSARPLPENAKMVPYYEPGVYDFAILDVDQQLANPNLGKTKLYKALDKLITDIPKVVINHGSPVYPEFLLNQEDEAMTKKNAEDLCKNIIRELVENKPMVVNSYDAASEKEWGWGTPIVHGMNPDDWWDLPKEPIVFTALSPGGCDEYYNRFCMNEVAKILLDKHGYQLLWAKVNTQTEKSFDAYRELLGSCLIYLDTSTRTPMNRARTEAMFSGACIVQVRGAHDMGRWARPEENMIIAPNDPESIADTLCELLENGYDKCIKIGQEGKKTAKELFNYKRYRDDWMAFLSEAL